MVRHVHSTRAWVEFSVRWCRTMVADLSLLGTRSQWKKRTVGEPTVSMLLVMWQGSNTFVEKSGPAGHLWSQEGAVFVGQCGQCQHFRVRNMCGKFTICGHCECCQMSDITYSSELFVVKKAAWCSLQVSPTAWCDCLCCQAIESAAAPLIDIYSQQEAIFFVLPKRRKSRWPRCHRNCIVLLSEALSLQDDSWKNEGKLSASLRNNDEDSPYGFFLS